MLKKARKTTGPFTPDFATSMTPQDRTSAVSRDITDTAARQRAEKTARLRAIRLGEEAPDGLAFSHETEMDV